MAMYHSLDLIFFYWKRKKETGLLLLVSETWLDGISKYSFFKLGLFETKGHACMKRVRCSSCHCIISFWDPRNGDKV